MNNLLYVLAMTVRIALSAIEILLFIRAILSWFPGLQNNGFANLIYTVTECIIFPIRVILDAIGIGNDSPIDLAFFITWILVLILSFFF